MRVEKFDHWLINLWLICVGKIDLWLVNPWLMCLGGNLPMVN